MDTPSPEPASRVSSKGASRGASWGGPPRTALLQRLFSIDARSLAVFRIGLGIIVLLDLAIRATDLQAMYTDAGMFPRAEILRRYAGVWNWSFHFASGDWGYQAMLFGLAAAMAISLLVGYQTRLATIGSWLLIISLQNRVPPVLNGGDGLLRMLLFWGMFLPLARVWSIDRWLRQRRGSTAPPPADGPVLSVASAAILLQMAFMYFFSAAFKTNTDWFRGDVIASTLAHDFYAKPLGTFFVQFPLLLKSLTLGIFVLEWVGPLLLFLPWRTLWVRMGTVAALMAMHLGIEMTLTVGLFSLISIAGLTLFLPSAFWDGRWFARVPALALKAPTAADPDSRTLPSKVGQAVCLLALVYVVVLNVQSLPNPLTGQPKPGKASFLRTACGLGQKWNMFDEAPSKDGWYVASAKLADGSNVDLLRHGAPVSWERPAYPAGMYPNHRWRKCFREMAYFDDFGYQVFRKPVAAYLCRTWDAQNPPERRIREFDFIYCMESDIRDPGSPDRQITLRERLVNLEAGPGAGNVDAPAGL